MNKDGKVISFLNMKGGVAKTTLCKEISLNLTKTKDNAERKKILLVDMDPQSNLTQTFFERFHIMESDDFRLENKPKASIENLFDTSDYINNKTLEDIILELDESLHIIPGELETIFMQRETSTGSAEQRLYYLISEYNLREKYDYIFIDCPPTYSFYTVAALLASDYYFVPLKPDVYSFLGLDLLQRVVHRITNTYKIFFEHKTLKCLGVIFTLVFEAEGEQKKQKQNIEYIKNSKFGSEVCFFESQFYFANSISTTRIDKSIIDGENKKLQGNLDDICNEFTGQLR